MPKQYLLLGGVPVLAHSLRTLTGHPGSTRLWSSTTLRTLRFMQTAAAPFAARLAPPVPGGATRQASVLAGLEALGPASPDRVLIHDAARPFLTAELVDDLVAALDTNAGAIAAEPVSDTLKRAAADGTMSRTVERAGLWRAQTPQGVPLRRDPRSAPARRCRRAAPTSPTMRRSPSGPGCR